LQGPPPYVVKKGGPPEQHPFTLEDTTVCITFAVSEPGCAGTANRNGNRPQRAIDERSPLLVTSAPVIAPAENSENDTEAVVMPTAKFGSNGDGTTTATGP